MDDKIKELKELIDKAENIVFFGGAGVSTESGIPDFRSARTEEKKYKYSFETILSSTFFFSHTKEFFDYYFDKMINVNARPNFAHTYLAELESAGKLKAVVTQNIDGLHQKAGSKTVYELHGSVHRNHCLRCNKFYSLDDVLSLGNPPKCSCGATVKPDVVLYGEELDDDTVEGAVNAIQQCDLLIVGGTSLVVYPAAGLINYAHGKIVLINRDHVPVSRKIDLEINAPIGETFRSLSELV